MSSPISGFTAVPNPYMVPLLYYQSLLIGAGFGIGYQGMKRKISALSNEDFNKLDLGTFAFQQFAEITAKSHFDKALNMMHPIMDKLAAAFGQMINKLPENFTSFFRGATGQPQTTTTDISFKGGLFGLPGLAGNNPLQASDPYTQWLQTKKLLEDQYKEFIRLSPSTKAQTTTRQKTPIRYAAFQPTTKFVQPISQAISQSQNKKNILINNLAAFEQQLVQALKLERRVKAIPIRATGKSRADKLRSRNNQQNAKDIELRRLKSIILDLLKKVQNAKTLLKNFR